MSEKQKRVEWQSRRGETVYADGKAITPVSQALTIRFGRYGAAVWNRATALEITENGETMRQPIPNMTLIGQIVGAGAAVFIGLTAYLLVQIKRTW